MFCQKPSHADSRPCRHSFSVDQGTTVYNVCNSTRFLCTTWNVNICFAQKSRRWGTQTFWQSKSVHQGTTMWNSCTDFVKNKTVQSNILSLNNWRKWAMTIEEPINMLAIFIDALIICIKLGLEARHPNLISAGVSSWLGFCHLMLLRYSTALSATRCAKLCHAKKKNLQC